MDQRTRKPMAMHKALHHRNDVVRLYQSRKDERELTSTEESVDALIQWLEDYIGKSRERLQSPETILTRRPTNNKYQKT